MTGLEYFVKCITKDYANFTGRARRREYWYFVLFNAISALLAAVLFLLFAGITGDRGTGYIMAIVLFCLVALAGFIPFMAVNVRRLHDSGKSGWFYLVTFIPLGSFVLFVFYLLDSEHGRNKWGENPKVQEYNLLDHLV